MKMVAVVQKNKTVVGAFAQFACEQDLPVIEDDEIRQERERIEAEFFESKAQPELNEDNEFGCRIKITDTQTVEGGYFGYGSYVQYKIETRAKGIPGLKQDTVYSVW